MSKYEDIFPGHSKWVPMPRKHTVWKAPDPQSMTSLKRIRRSMKQHRVAMLKHKCNENIKQLKSIKSEIPAVMRQVFDVRLNSGINLTKMTYKQLTGTHGFLCEELKYWTNFQSKVNETPKKEVENAAE